MTTTMRAGLAAVLGAAAYSGTLPNGFVRDDAAAIVQNPVVNGAVPAWEAFGRDAWGGRKTGLLGIYRPLPVLLYRAEWWIGGGSPAIFHAVNVALHASVCAAIVWALFEIGGIPVFAGALFFAVLAAASEAVEAPIGCSDLLVALGAVIGLGLHLRGRIWPAALVAFLAMLCKESAAFVPAAWLMFELMLRPPADLRSSLLQRARPYLAYGVMVGIAIAMRGLAFNPLLRPAMNVVGNPLGLARGPARWLGASRVVFRYASGTLDPTERLYGCGAPHCGGASAEDLRAWLGLLIVVALIVTPFLLRRRAALAGAGLAWCAVSFLPISSLVVLSSAGYAERLLYLPFIGLMLAAGVAIESIGAAARRPVLGQGLLVALGLANLIALQQRHWEWRSMTTLSVADADRLPGNALLESNAAFQAFLQHDAALAFERADRALRSDPGNVLALDVAGLALDRLDRPVEAEQTLRRGFEESGQAPDVTQDYVRFLLRHHRSADARAVLKSARAKHPGVPLLPHLDAEIDRAAR